MHCQKNIKFYDTDLKTKLKCMNFVDCTLEKWTDPTHLLLSGEARFELSRHLNSNCHRITRLIIHEMGDGGVQVGVWCVVSAAGIVWSIIFSDCTNSSRYVTRQTPTPFVIHQNGFPVILSLFKIKVDLEETQMLGHRRILKQSDGNTGIYHHERGVP